MFLLMMAAVTLASCSEEEPETVDEYANWQARNDQAFADTIAKAKANADGLWWTYRSYSLDKQTPTQEGTSISYGDNTSIAVHVEKEGVGTVSPLVTDSVKVSYQGRLIPTAFSSDGSIFDGTFASSGVYDENTALAANFKVGDLVDGFATTLLHMHVGDHWKVFIPYDLGYGSSTSNSAIPAYSMLRFEIVLRGYYHDGKWIGQ